MTDIKEIRLKLKQNLTKGLKYSLQSVEEVLKTDGEKYDNFILLKGRYSDFDNLSNKNLQSFEFLGIELEKIRSNILQIINSLEKSDLKNFNTNFNDKSPKNRKENFFELLKIYSSFLSKIEVTITKKQGNKIVKSTKLYGKKAIHQIYIDIVSNLFRVNDKDDLIKYLNEYFDEVDDGIIETYFSSIQNLLLYIDEDSVDNIFFCRTFTSQLSRYEKVFCIYYSLIKDSTDFFTMLKNRGFFEENKVIKTLIKREFII